MPKIKLSALATDIKGKSGGSVFSTNSGGTYFRNNPSGGGRKTNTWNEQKVNFGAVSTQWKNLTEAQQEAWATAAPNFPTVNAFGEPRIPSGNELFMRLNSTLYSSGLPILSVPPSPAAFPSLGNFTLFNPDKWAFTPQNAAIIGKQSPTAQNFGFAYANDDLPFDSSQPFAVFLRFQPILLNATPTVQGNLYPLFVLGDLGADYLACYLLNPAPNQYEIRISVSVGGSTVRNGSWFFTSSFDRNVKSIGINFEPSDLTQTVLFLDGNILPPVGIQSSNFSAADYNDRMLIGAPSGGSIPTVPEITDFDDSSSLLVADVRIFNDALSNQTQSRIHNGYRAATTAGWFSFAELNTTDQINYGNESLDGLFVPQNYLNSIPVFSPISFLFQPFLRLEWENPGGPDDYLAVFASNAFPSSKGSSNNRFRRLITIPIDGIQEYDLSTAWALKWHDAPNDSNITFYADIIKGDTGQSTRAAGPKKNIVRFKKGGDLNKNV